VQHRNQRPDAFLAEYLDQMSELTIKEAEDKEPLRAGHVYLAPAGYHLLIEPERTFGLSVDERVNYSCPSIDVLFESAAEVFAGSLIGVVLTGANKDGAQGLKAIKARGGLAIVQNPENAKAEVMPRAALAATEVDYIVELGQLAPLLLQLTVQEGEVYGTNG
jgi:two-component system chemotaxis response regulator CheB